MSSLLILYIGFLAYLDLTLLRTQLSLSVACSSFCTHVKKVEFPPNHYGVEDLRFLGHPVYAEAVAAAEAGVLHLRRGLSRRQSRISSHYGHLFHVASSPHDAAMANLFAASFSTAATNYTPKTSVGRLAERESDNDNGK